MKRQSFVLSSAPIKAWWEPGFKLGAQKSWFQKVGSKKLILLREARCALGRENKSHLRAELGAALLSQNPSYFPEKWPQVRNFALKSGREKSPNTSTVPPSQWSLLWSPGKAESWNHTKHRQAAANNKYQRYKSSRGLEASPFKGWRCLIINGRLIQLSISRAGPRGEIRDFIRAI